MIAKIGAQHLRDGKGDMPVRNREQNALGHQRPEQQHLFLVAGRTKPAALAGEGEQMVFLAVIATDAGEAALQISAIHELVHHLGDDGAQKAMTGLIALLIDRLKAVKMPGEALPEWRCPGLPGTINLRNHALQRTEGGVSNSGTPLKKV